MQRVPFFMRGLRGWVITLLYILQINFISSFNSLFIAVYLLFHMMGLYFKYACNKIIISNSMHPLYFITLNADSYTSNDWKIFERAWICF